MKRVDVQTNHEDNKGNTIYKVFYNGKYWGLGIGTVEEVTTIYKEDNRKNNYKNLNKILEEKERKLWIKLGLIE